MCLIKSSTSFNTVQGTGIDDETTPSPQWRSQDFSLGGSKLKDKIESIINLNIVKELINNWQIASTSKKKKKKF